MAYPKKRLTSWKAVNLKDDKIQKQILHYGSLLKDFPNHLSIHAGGMLISDLPINQYTATELPPKNFLTSQIDMHVAEKIGLFKLDILKPAWAWAYKRMHADGEAKQERDH